MASLERIDTLGAKGFAEALEKQAAELCEAPGGVELVCMVREGGVQESRRKRRTGLTWYWKLGSWQEMRKRRGVKVGAGKSSRRLLGSRGADGRCEDCEHGAGGRSKRETGKEEKRGGGGGRKGSWGMRLDGRDPQEMGEPRGARSEVRMYWRRVGGVDPVNHQAQQREMEAKMMR
eukprot:761575-Hanusia_phi.AAC.5